jgi:hypothetical protein
MQESADPTTGKRDPHDGTMLRWYDAAEGNPVVAFFATVQPVTPEEKTS